MKLQGQSSTPGCLNSQSQASWKESQVQQGPAGRGMRWEMQSLRQWAARTVEGPSMRSLQLAAVTRRLSWQMRRQHWTLARSGVLGRSVLDPASAQECCRCRTAPLRALASQTAPLTAALPASQPAECPLSSCPAPCSLPSSLAAQSGAVNLHRSASLEVPGPSEGASSPDAISLAGLGLSAPLQSPAYAPEQASRPVSSHVPVPEPNPALCSQSLDSMSIQQTQQAPQSRVAQRSSDSSEATVPSLLEAPDTATPSASDESFGYPNQADDSTFVTSRATSLARTLTPEDFPLAEIPHSFSSESMPPVVQPSSIKQQLVQHCCTHSICTLAFQSSDWQMEYFPCSQA